MNNTSKQTGDEAERVVAAYLIGKGWTISEANYHCRRGEIDLVAKIGFTLVFVEVKSGRNEHFGSPALRVNLSKQKKLIRAAQTYLQSHSLDGFEEIRFDVVSLTQTRNSEWKINHIEDAFRPVSPDESEGLGQ